MKKDVAQRRYYLNRTLKKIKEVELDPITRTIRLPYKSFEQIPIGVRFYIGQCIQLQYNVQYELL